MTYFSLFSFLIRIPAIAILCIMVLLFTAGYIQPIGCDIGVYSGLTLSTLLPVKPQKLTQKERANFVLSDDLRGILIGLILGDLHICKPKLDKNPRLMFIQGLIHKDYIDHLYDLFKSYCLTAPRTVNPSPDKRTGKVYSVVVFNSFSLPCFHEFLNLFYPEGKKIIPLNIGDLLTPSSLAYWLADDGTFSKLYSCVILCTNSYTLEEVNLLVKILNDKWDLKCTINKDGKGFRIRIPSKSLPVLQELLKDKMPSMMLHKIGL